MTRDHQPSKNILSNAFLIFFLAPMIFFVISWVSGNGLLSEFIENRDRRFRWSLSAGALFYFALLLIIIYNN